MDQARCEVLPGMLYQGWVLVMQVADPVLKVRLVRELMGKGPQSFPRVIVQLLPSLILV